VNWGLLALSILIVGVIAASNVWLRRRAEAADEADESSDAPTG